MKNNTDSRSSAQKRQNGSALLIGLIILVMLTLLGITTMKSSVLQERMAGNLRDTSVAFESAEAALREVIQTGNVADKAYDGTQTGYGEKISAFTDSAGDPVTEYKYWNSVFDWDSNSIAATQPSGASAKPQSFVETIPVSTGVWRAGERSKRSYRITVKAAGASDRSQAILQGTILLED